MRLHLSLSIITAVAIFASAAVGEPLAKIPNGYQNGRSDALYGTYTSIVGERARGYQNRVANLERRAMGLADIAADDRVKFSESVYLMEYAALRLHLEIADAPAKDLSAFERETLLFQTTRTYEKVRVYGERLFEDMVRFIDVQIPGPNGIQVHAGTVDGQPVYHPNYRTDRDLTDAERAALYKEKLGEFQAAGGSLDEVKELTPDLLARMKAYTRVEYAELENGKTFVSEGKAGHILIAGGKKARAAGQMIFLKDRHGKFTLLVVSNSSGSFKPDLSSALKLGNRLGQQLGLGMGQIVITKGEPLSTQAVKVYSKGLGGSYLATVKDRVARLNEMEKLLNSSRIRLGRTCADLFAPMRP